MFFLRGGGSLVGMARALLLHTWYYRTESDWLSANVQHSQRPLLPLILLTAVEVDRQAMEEAIPGVTPSCDKRTKAC